MLPSSVPSLAARPSPARAPAPGETTRTWEGTDLSLPEEFASPLALALKNRDLTLDVRETPKRGNDSIKFHRIRCADGSVALLYVDAKRIEASSETFIYAWCMRIRKFFLDEQLLCIVFLRPPSTTFPNTWFDAGQDARDVRVVPEVFFRSVDYWNPADEDKTMRDVRDWLGDVRLLPQPKLIPVGDSFDNRQPKPQQQQNRVPREDAAPQVFISYAASDKDWVEKILTGDVKSLGEKACRFWYDKDISAGDVVVNEIRTKLEASPIVMMLVSDSFLASDFFESKELGSAMEAADRGEKRILWIYVRPALDLEVQKIRKWQPMHNVDAPLSRQVGDDLKKSFEDIRDALANAIKIFRAEQKAGNVKAA